MDKAQQIASILARNNTKAAAYKLPFFTPDEAATILFNRYEYRCAVRGMLIENREEIFNLCKRLGAWLTNETARPWLFIVGPVGTGKTTLLSALTDAVESMGMGGRAIRENGVQMGTYQVSAIDLPALVMDNDPHSIYRDFILRGLEHHQFLCLDDLGQEPLEVKLYGNSLLPFVEIVTKRYESRKPIIVTSNLTMQDIGATYGERVADRLREMADIISLTGKSHRTNTTL